MPRRMRGVSVSRVHRDRAAAHSRVADLGELPSALPFFSWPDVPWNLETLKIILPTSVALAAVGLLESLMTASIVDDMTETPSNKNRECAGQGLANIVSGCFGGMAGCVMIGRCSASTRPAPPSWYKPGVHNKPDALERLLEH
ncbi:MAG: sulfate permease and related transporter superfamily [Verrucomicrobiales bacterium]|nr:sulfate permease and related transporter superfamily [Verrucomicrobiales bacterium]